MLVFSIEKLNNLNILNMCRIKDITSTCIYNVEILNMVDKLLDIFSQRLIIEYSDNTFFWITVIYLTD